MQFFDLVDFDEGSLAELTSRLGYKKAFHVGKDIEMIERMQGGGNEKVMKIVQSSNDEVVMKALRQNDVIGAIAANDTISKKALEVLKNNEKLLIIPLSPVVCAEEGARTQKLIRTRLLVRAALMSKARIAIVSMAQCRECLMSTLQMLEVANFLGIEQERAKEALGVLGGAL